ncbi:MAG: hypothetical protein KC917_00055 [Candidatus Omnitrophica bacterium]|nr:hypothetical protein [Candidatus Omnitrophota bacterium]MCA9440272.1 hypothetical protein [Candidatus Omnitrophota bacterium]
MVRPNPDKTPSLQDEAEAGSGGAVGKDPDGENPLIKEDRIMGLTRINNNISALNANRNLIATDNSLKTSLERLSSGLRINRAADDAAGLTISENLRSQINGINRAIDNASDAINLVNTAEGALIETTNRLQRIRELAVQAANGTNDAVALQAIQDEIETGISEITRIGNDTQFATQRLLNGDFANSATISDTGAGVSLANSPVATSLSTGTHFLEINQTNAGSETLSNGTDGVNNSGATTFTGSTFDSGTYELVLSNVRAEAARVVQFDFSVGAGTTAGANLNGSTFTDGAGNTFALGTTDEITFSGTESDGSTFTVTITVGTSVNATGVLGVLNGALGTDSASYDAATGTFRITAATVGETTLSGGFVIDDNGGGAPNEFSTGEVVLTAGNLNDGVLVFADGTAQTIQAGQTVTALGPDPSDPSEQQQQITFTLGNTLTAGTDLITIVQQEFTGSLNGGQTVTFQNGDQEIRFRSGSGAGFPSGETVTLNFDAALLAGASSQTLQIEAVNNALNFQVGANRGQQVKIALGDLRADQLGDVGNTQPSGNDRTVSGINVTTLTGANEAIDIIDLAINQVDQQRSALGAFTNRLDATISNLGVAAENLTASESRIRDADIAVETTKFTRNQILLQAGISILAQANLQPQNVLALIG